MRQIKSLIFLALIEFFLIYSNFSYASLELQSAYYKDCKCGDEWTVRIDGGYNYGEFIGMKRGYAELGLFVAPQHSNRVQNFFDATGYFIDNGEGAASIGVGRRLWDADSCRILGANIYYDFRHGRIGVFNRIGIGLESLGECVDFRINGYFPLNKGTRQKRLHTYHDFIGPYFETCQEKEFAYLGFDAEVGSPIWNDCLFDLYGAIGPYFYHHKEREGIYGGYARLSLSFDDWLILEGRVSSDNRFKTHVQGSLIISVPLYQFFSCYSTGSNACREMLTQPVERNGLIFTDPCCSRTYNWDDN
jgi:hypothetical protein